MKNDREMMEALLAGEALVNMEGGEWKLDENGDLDTCTLPMPSTVEIKPKTININGFEVPEPLRKIKRNGDIVYVVSLEGVFNVTLCM